MLKRTQLLFLTALLSSILLLTACGKGQIFEDPSNRATREAEQAQLVETIDYMDHELERTDALQATADAASAMERQILDNNARSASLEATIRAATNPGAADVPVSGSSSGNSGGSKWAGNNGTVNSDGGSPITSQSGGQPNFATDNTQSQAAAVQTARDVNDADGCAVGIANTFTSGEDSAIYLTTVARNVQPGNVYQSRWYLGGELRFESVTWEAGQSYDEVCIYFWVEPGDMEFTPGTWTAEMLENQQVMGEAQFDIMGTAEAE
jgi:hypothetical protein